jgi:hypothetical protein
VITVNGDKTVVGLVGPTPGGGESLGLAYLAASLRAAGHDAHVVTFDTWADIDRVAHRIAELDPQLVGVSLPSGLAAIDGLAFVHLLRRLGYAGHVTCGGAHATLARRRILERHPAVDSVVRYDGEIPIVRLADRIAAGRGAGELPGVTTRAGDGQPAPFDCEPFVGMQPERDRLRYYAGVPSAKISAVRGCFGRCRYCGLAGVRREKRAEALGCGMSRRQVKDAGIGGMRRRPAADVAGEMAGLYHEHGVRFFHFVDENHLPPSEARAVALIHELGQELELRGVGPRAISMMLRADIATGPVVDSLADLGVVRSFLGVESMSRDSLSALRRNTTELVNLPAMDHLRRRGILFHFNLLLVHPDSTLDSIGAEIGALSGVKGGLLDPFEVEIYEGTDYFRHLNEEGRLRGGPLLWFYEPVEEGAARFARIFHLLRHHALGHVPLTSFAYDVQGLLAVTGQQGLVRPASHRMLRLRLDALTRSHNRLWVEVLEEALALAHSGGEALSVSSLLERTRERAAELVLEIDEVRKGIERACERPPRCEIGFPRTAAAVVIAAAVLGGGCWQMEEPAFPEDDWDDAGQQTGQPNGGGITIDVECPPATLIEEHGQIEDAAMDAGCEHVCTLPYVDNIPFSYRFLLDEDGHVTGMEREDGEPLPDEIVECYLEAVADQTFPCLAQVPYWESCEPLALE